MGIQKSSGNTSVGGAIIAAICIIIYLGALVQCAVRFYLSIEDRRGVAEYEFSQLTAQALSAGTQGFMDDRFVQTMKNALASKQSIEAIIIRTSDGQFAFERQSGRAVSWVNNTPRFLNRFGLSNQNYYKPLPIPGLRDAAITGVAGFFDYIAFSKILRETLLIILGGFALAFFTILLQLLLGGKSTYKTETVYRSAPEPSREIRESRETEEFRYAPSETDGPKGLYSSRSNIGWDEYTKDRLDSELHRCSSTEKDLTLIIMEFSEVLNDAMFKHAAEEAVNFFASRDLLFEHGRLGITVILPFTSLDVGISKSEKFNQRMMEKFPRGYGLESCLSIGLSSRSGRLINAERLIFEANEALKKAKSDPRTSIVAFKSDLEKYRDYIRTKS
jgi:GGDEF domain-containing protein